MISFINKTIFYLLLFLLCAPHLALSVELKLVCVSRADKPKSQDFNDLIISLSSNSNKIEIGSLKFEADEMMVTDSNIKWFASDIENLYSDSSGHASGILGRFSGNLALKFKKMESDNDNQIWLNCSQLKMKDRKF
ncbi:MAG: hypothetical protein CMM91_10310 [Rickettsiales bacterium]|nr:hypothetical protein [Rickettsiales bacterium]OUV52867.1 MAG: hypothetical protein CBC87_05795 [Rickettsiales bacterium TMED127]|tara:strand:- start:8372 stop:8779 length:408 start_codon:yes stop_codon:yes gene_type:complete